MTRWLLLVFLAWPVLGAEPQLIVAPFQNSRGEAADAGLETVLQDLLIARLSQAKAVVVLDRSDLDRLLKEQHISVAGWADPATAAKTGKLLGAKFAVLGSFQAVDRTLQVHAHVVEVATGAIVAAREVAAPPAELIQIGDSLGKQLLDDLHLKPDQPQSPLPADLAPQANLAFLRGVALFLSGQYDEAQIQFLKARQFNPRHLDAVFWSGRAYFEQKQYDHAALEFERYLHQAAGSEQAEMATRFLTDCQQNMTAEEKTLIEQLQRAQKQD